MRFIIITVVFLCFMARQSPAAVSTDVQLEVSNGQLGATLLRPDGSGPWPVVLILAGSGLTDRDGNTPNIPGKNNSLRQLAEGLARQGVASLRTDKRGVAGSQSAALSEKNLRFNHFINDAVQWVFWLQNDSRFSSVSIAGHSQGAQVGMSAAWLSGADGFVSLAGSGRPILEVLREQLHDSLNIRSRVKANALLEELEAGRLVPDPPTELTILFRPSVQEFLISWQHQNPQQSLGRLSCPVTIIQGLNDLQVSETDARLLHEAKPGATLLLLPGVNHIFKPVEGDNPVVHQMALANPDLVFSQDAIDAVVSLTVQADIFHQQWNAALDRVEKYNADRWSNEDYLPDDDPTQPIGPKISNRAVNREKGTTSYLFGLAEGGYVTEGRLLTGGNDDCVSFRYRCTELARAQTKRENYSWALRTRFAGAAIGSIVGPDGRVDYDSPEHLDFSLDMIRSGIWGRDVSAAVGEVQADAIGTSRYPAGSFSWIPAEKLDQARLKQGDIVWFVLNPENKKARKLRDEYGLVVGHIGVMAKCGNDDQLCLLHAASSDLSGQYEGGQVVSVDLSIYLERVERYAGVFVTRLE